METTTSTIIDGKAIASDLRAEVARGVHVLQEHGGPVPRLETVLVGDDPASATYVRMKHKAAAEVGIDTIGHELPADTPQSEVEELVTRLSYEPKVHGILVQLPLPDGLDEAAVLANVALDKDVDGFQPANMGLLAQKGREPFFVPPTPAGVLALIKTTGIELEGANAVVLGRSNIVGMPTALLLVGENSTVTICHSRTRDLPAVCRTADVLVAAVGRAQMVKGDWIKPGAIVIDVGTNSIEDPSKKSGRRLVGDVDFDEAVQVAGAITPVPGGVGPMTVAGLLKNTLIAAERTVQN